MAKGYWIGRVEVNNEEGYKPYAAANAAMQAAAAKTAELAKVCGLGKLQDDCTCLMPPPSTTHE